MTNTERWALLERVATAIYPPLWEDDGFILGTAEAAQAAINELFEPIDDTVEMMSGD